MKNIKKLLSYLFNLEFYVSPLDQFLANFRKKHPNQSASQHREEKKYAEIFKRRDNPNAAEPKSDKIWNNF